MSAVRQHNTEQMASSQLLVEYGSHTPALRYVTLTDLSYVAGCEEGRREKREKSYVLQAKGETVLDQAEQNRRAAQSVSHKRDVPYVPGRKTQQHTDSRLFLFYRDI